MFIKHSQIAATFLKVVNLLNNWFRAIIWCEFNFNLSWFCDNIILAPILISECMSTNNDGLCPSWDKSWDVRNDDWFSEHGSIKNVSNSSVGRSPHLLKLEFLNSAGIWSNCSALDSNFMLLCCFCSVNSDLIICLIA